LSVYDLWLIVICLYNRVILDDFIPEFCNFEVGHSRILQFSRSNDFGEHHKIQDVRMTSSTMIVQKCVIELSANIPRRSS